ncbi:hypothetical protein N9R81_00085 [Flavobacteriales bacterium]|nr:hypothetical protein [Flavobacteriales bacterium]
MILDSTVLTPEEKTAIDGYVGKAFSIFKIIQVGTIGSHRMIVQEYSEDFTKYLNRSTDLNYCNIELRPLGIIVHLAKDRSRFSWVIPYYRLVFFDSKTFSIHGEGHFLKIRRDNNWKMNRKFIQKILSFKQKALEGSTI